MTSTRTVPFEASSATPIDPPSGVQRNAFLRRFVITWRTRSPSVMIVGAVSDAAQRVRDLAPPRLVAERAVRLLDEAAHVDLLRVHREPVGAELREVEHVADEPLEPRRLVRDDVERGADELRVVDEPVPQRVDVPLDRGQRRPELVRDRHQELALALLGRREPRGHLVEALGEVRDLASAAADRNLHRVVPGGDLVRGARERLDRAADPAREPRAEEPGKEAADRDRRREPADERHPLLADDVARLRHDEGAERRPAGLEPQRLGDREERLSLARRP